MTVKKKKPSKTVEALKNIFQFKKWADAERVQSITDYFLSFIRRLFVPGSSKKTEEFSDAVKRMGLNENDLQQRAKALLRMVWLMIVCAIGAQAYAIYLFIEGAWYAGLFTFVVVGIALAMAFRYHFWYFQIKSRKLGCSLQEWFWEGLLGEKS